VSTTARQYWLKVLRSIGVKQFRATSGLGLPYICHVGDFAGEVPFYSARHSAAEILLMASWCRDMEAPVIFDVGANNGFVSTQVAQLLRDQSPQIYAFEPVPSTFSQMVQSIELLSLGQFITPLCCALSDSTGFCTIAYNPRESLFAQVRSDDQNLRAGTQLAVAPTMTIDSVMTTIRKKPSLIKVDVEGFELQVLKGAVALLSGDNPPAICFEWNPITMGELGTSPNELLRLLQNYQLYYIDDFEGQKKPFGEEIAELSLIDWVCNVFAVSREKMDKWTDARSRIASSLAHDDS
jgi:FkbM family methyltransferase